MNFRSFLISCAGFYSLASFCLAKFSSPHRNTTKYALGDKSGFGYDVDAEKQPELFITLELMFRAALRGEEGAGSEFCSLVDKITEDGSSAEGYSNDLIAIITIVGDQNFAMDIAGVKISQKGRGRLWEYLTWNNSKAEYPLTRRALLGE